MHTIPTIPYEPISTEHRTHVLMERPITSDREAWIIHRDAEDNLLPWVDLGDRSRSTCRSMKNLSPRRVQRWRAKKRRK